MGHGVSMMHLNACTLRDLLLEKQTDLTAKPVRQPAPHPLAARTHPPGCRAGHPRLLAVEDWWYERELKQA